jgi:hypothetical protein
MKGIDITHMIGVKVTKDVLFWPFGEAIYKDIHFLESLGVPVESGLTHYHYPHAWNHKWSMRP